MKVSRYMSNAKGKGLQVSLGCNFGFGEQLIGLLVKHNLYNRAQSCSQGNIGLDAT